MLQRRIDENQKRLHELMLLQNRMQQAVQLWDGIPDAAPNDECICVLIESFDADRA
jgi:hypothetical protein